MKRIRFLLLTLVALLAGINASATKTVYVDPVGTGTWMTDNPAISLYVFGDGDGWASSTTLSDGVIKFTFDDISLADSDLVKIVGREFVGLGLVAPQAIVKITK